MKHLRYELEDYWVDKINEHDLDKLCSWVCLQNFEENYCWLKSPKVVWGAHIPCRVAWIPSIIHLAQSELSIQCWTLNSISGEPNPWPAWTVGSKIDPMSMLPQFIRFPTSGSIRAVVRLHSCLTRFESFRTSRFLSSDRCSQTLLTLHNSPLYLDQARWDISILGVKLNTVEKKLTDSGVITSHIPCKSHKIQWLDLARRFSLGMNSQFHRVLDPTSSKDHRLNDSNPERSELLVDTCYVKSKGVGSVFGRYCSMIAA